MKFEIKGAIHKVFDAKQVSERFTKREFVLSVEDGKYPQTVLFETSGGALEQLDGLTAGDEVTVHFSVRGREWRSPKGETKYFTSLHAWKVEPTEAKKSSSTGRQQSAPPPADSPPVDDDCPF